MEVRCASCNKLFRVSDDKITGRGIKFPCTRCGESVKITHEAFEHYTLSQSAVSALDLFDPKPKPVPITEPSPEQSLSPEPEVHAAEAEPEKATPTIFDPMQSSETVSKEEQPPAFEEPAPFVEEASREQQAAPGEPTSESQAIPEPVLPVKEEALPAQPAVTEERKPAPSIVEVRETKPEPTKQAMPVPPPVPEVPKPEVVRPAAQTVSPPQTPIQPAASKKERPRTATPKAAEKPVPEPISAARESGPGSVVWLGIAALIVILGIAGYFAYSSFQPAQKSGAGITRSQMPVDLLRISNAAGSVEADGDLLITGNIENISDKEQATWLVVVDVYDAKGNVLTKIKMLNGRQLFTKRDFEILAKRGKNIQEIKAKLLQDQRAPIAPKGTITFEIRYVQPPVGVASFNANLSPFDPVQIRKEVIEEIR